MHMVRLGFSLRGGAAILPGNPENFVCIYAVSGDFYFLRCLFDDAFSIETM
jgi:hypothetical protein